MPSKKERLDSVFSVFNLHINRAKERADAEFISQFGRKNFNETIKPLHDGGIMSIFDFEGDRAAFGMKAAYIALVTFFVNEDRK